jgi:hypothetical protein
VCNSRVPPAWAGTAFTCLGVGIDLEELNAIDHLSLPELRRAALRWLRAGERAWCQSQISFRSSIIVTFCCKEAVFKASPGICPTHEISLNLWGRLPTGRAMWDEAPVPIHVVWHILGGRVVALAAGEQLGAPAVLQEWLAALPPRLGSDGLGGGPHIAGT